MNYEERRQKCIEEHRCPNCYNKHDELTVYCKTCREWRKKYNRKRVCKDCGTPIPTGNKSRRCEPCKNKIKKVYWKSWEANLSDEERKEWRIRNRDYMREWRKKNQSRHQDRTLKRRYDISFYVAQQLYESQNGKCAICKNPIPKIDDPNKKRNNLAHIDHNHKTNKVRGLLCPHCNYLLGNCKDSVVILENAIDYLKNHSSL